MSPGARAAWVGLDLGTQSVRALALGDDGTLLGVAAQPLTSRRTGDRHEQDPESWWTAARTALRELTAQLPADVEPRAVATSGTSGTVVPVHRDGRPAGPGVMYDDRRGAPYLPRVTEAGAALFARLGYRMQASWGLPTILALQAEGLLADDGVVVAHQPDVVTARLAGRLLPSDLGSALKSGADLDAVAWPDDVLAALDLRTDRLNGLAESGAVLGSVGVEGSIETGLPVGCRIVAGTTDGCAAQLAAGALAPGAWNSVLGTTLVLKGVAAERRTDPTGSVYAHRAPFGQGWYPGGASSTGAGALARWLPGRDPVALTDRLDGWVDPAPAYPLAGRGERFPFVAAEAEAFFPPGLLVEGDRAVFAAVLSGVAWVERLAFDLLGLVGYDTSGPVLLTGGGTRNDLWNRLRADTLGTPVWLPRVAEGAAGMAVLAAAGFAAAESGGTADPLADAARRLLPPPTRIDPDLRQHRLLMPVYRAFLDELGTRGWAEPALLAHARERSGA